MRRLIHRYGARLAKPAAASTVTAPVSVGTGRALDFDIWSSSSTPPAEPAAPGLSTDVSTVWPNQ